VFFFPVKYSFYEFKESVPERESDWPIEIEHPPFGGCFSACRGFSVNKTCSKYLRKYDDCTATCYGIVYNNCFGLLNSLISKFSFLENIF